TPTANRGGSVVTPPQVIGSGSAVTVPTVNRGTSVVTPPQVIGSGSAVTAPNANRGAPVVKPPQDTGSGSAVTSPQGNSVINHEQDILAICVQKLNLRNDQYDAMLEDEDDDF